MNTLLILIYESVLFLLLATIIFFAQVQKNLPLSLALNKILLLLSLLNLALLSYLIHTKLPICHASQLLFC